MSSNPPEIGTLIVVVLKANHLPNKRHIGKQDPYCVVTVNGEKRRTKAIKRGGQHPEWDEEIRFTLYEDTEDGSDQKDGSPPPLPPKSTRKPKKIKGGMTMKVACFADDPREPDFIGETDVDLTEALTKGETDEWFTLTNKEKFSGKVYLELTFWSNVRVLPEYQVSLLADHTKKERPPEKKVTKPQKANKYAGPGYFNPADDQSQITSHSMISNGQEQSRLTDSVSSALRVPNPKAQSELIYDPPYLHRHSASTFDRVSTDFGELDLSDHRNSPQGGHFISSSISSGFSVAPIGQPTHSFDFSTTGQTYMHPHDRPITPVGPTHAPPSALIPSSLQPGPNSVHDLALVNGAQHPNRRSRIPTSSSGFVPLHGHTSIPSHPSETAGLVSYNPTGILYNTHYPTQPYTSALSQASASTIAIPYAPAPVPTTFTPQPYQSPQLSQYSQYSLGITLPAPALPTPASSYVSPGAAVSPQVQQMNPQYVSGNGPSPTHDQGTYPLQGHPSLMFGSGSRPLPPQPQIAFGQTQIPSAYATSQAMTPQHTIQPNNVMYQPPVPFPSTQQPLPPPPPPPHPVSYNAPTYVPDAHPVLPPPPPPPLSETEQAKARARRRSSLPRPPVNFIQPPPPPPPPLPVNNHLQTPLPPPPPPLQSTSCQTSHPGPPPKPPVMVDSQFQWLPSSTPQPLQGGYGPAVI